MRTLAFAVFAAFLVVASPRGQEPKPTDLTPEQALDELRSKRDDADLALAEQASKAGTEAAARGLASVYDQIRTGTGASAVALGGSSGNRLVAPGTSSAVVDTFPDAGTG